MDSFIVHRGVEKPALSKVEWDHCISSPVAARMLKFYATFADDCEYRQKIGEPKQLPNPRAKVDEFQSATR